MTTLLLTASVDPRGCSFTPRSDPRVRFGDYRTALTKWLAARLFTKIVWCENSAWPQDEWADVQHSALAAGIDLELLSFDGQGYDRSLGKGYGEMGIIAHALAHSRILGAEGAQGMVVKMTGRYFVPNLTPLIRMMKTDHYSIICDLRNNLIEADSRVFAADQSFFRDELLPLQPLANDNAGCYFEHLLARATHRALGQGKVWGLMPMVPRVDGIGGSTDCAHHVTFSKRLRHQLKRRLVRY